MRSIDRPIVAERISAIPPFHVMEIVRIAKDLEAQGIDVIHLEIGEPDFPATTSVIERAFKALESGQTRYTDARGTSQLRDALSTWYGTQGIFIPPERIQITVGASGGLLLAIASTTNPGNGVLIPDPAYPCNPRFVELVGGIVRWVQTDEKNHFQPTKNQLEMEALPTDRTLMLAHPSNPTGHAVPQDELREIIQWCEETKRHLIIDEIYQNLSFNDELKTSLNFSHHHFVVGSFSKYFNMTGWRIGWLVIPEYALEATQRLAQHLFICAPSLAQEAALACFEPSAMKIAEAQRRELKIRRDLLIPRLKILGFEIAAEPEGAFYIFADAAAFTIDAEEFCTQLILQTGVAITPGIDFSQSLPPTWVRIAFTQPLSRLEEALQRIAQFIHD